MSGQSDNIISDGNLVIKRITEGITVNTGDIEIGAVELKDGATDARAAINAANTARTTATVVQAVQQVSAAGAVDTLTTVTGVGTLTTLTGGGVAANAADSGNPVKVGGKYVAAGVTLDDGDRGDVGLDSKSNLNSNLNTLISGEDQTIDVLKVENRYSYAYCVADTAVKASAGFVHSLTFSPLDAAATAGTIFLYDQTSEAVPTVFSYYIPAAALVPVTVILDVVCTTGIYIGFTTVADVACTVAFR
jgi:hypothetical protein